MEDIYDPITAYTGEFRDKFKKVAEKTFSQLAQEAGIDEKANKQTCSRLYRQEQALASAKTRIVLCTTLCVVLWMGVIGAIVVGITNFNQLDRYLLVALGAAAIAVIVILFLKLHPFLKKLKARRNALVQEIKKLKDEAWRQMEPLNRLYDWDVLTRMMVETVPKLEFDPYFTTRRLADLENIYGWDNSFNAKRSVIYSHSGLINGNPFVICRTRKMEMGQKTYYGSKTIYWTSRERGADGKYHSVRHSQTLTASVTAPFPEYFEKTRLIYANTAAPDLIFHRKQSNLASKEKSLSFKWKRFLLRRKSRNLKHADYAMMTNEEFEVAFDTSDRNNNQQFALLFTPLAQEAMLKLLKDEEAGFGDDFDFDKEKMINVIFAEHMQQLNLDLNPEQYKNFDYEKAKADFYTINERYFRAIYFCFAPLLCVPMYQQIRPESDIYGRDMKQHSSFWEHEALANFWGQNHFKAPNCVTDCILKTEERTKQKDKSTIVVHAHGYTAQKRLTYVSKWGADGRSHRVPVYWDEYIPVTGTGTIYIKEDNSFEDKTATTAQRITHISKVLADNNLQVYRRHIASRI